MALYKFQLLFIIIIINLHTYGICRALPTLAVLLYQASYTLNPYIGSSSR